MRKFKKCRYSGGICYICRELPNGHVRLVTSDPQLVPDDASWEQVDKLEWEKTVPVSDIQIISDSGTDADPSP